MKKVMPAGPLRRIEASRQGFTLVELLVSIAIIATLTAILLPNFMGARERAKDAKTIQDLASIKNALRMYFNDKQTYPGAADDTMSFDLDTKLVGYMSPIGIGYTYIRKDNGDGFLLEAVLDSGQGTDFLGSQTRCGVPGSVPNLYVVCAK
jgi:prepilin-type N-terminal cleavage/methylation domain-containing protein